MSLSPAPSTTSNSDTGSVYHEDEILSCLWKKCNRQFDDAESLYSHLSVDHVGRKSTGNLCLECHWDDCDVRTTKRDHITSHLRVHVPLKPHICEKAFKRPQDLKKHYKIHSEYHQQQLTNLKNHRITKKLLIKFESPLVIMTTSEYTTPPSPSNIDPEEIGETFHKFGFDQSDNEDEDKKDNNEKLDKESLGREHYENVGKSSLRQNLQFNLNDPKYAGKQSSRKNIFGDFSELKDYLDINEELSELTDFEEDKGLSEEFYDFENTDDEESSVYSASRKSLDESLNKSLDKSLDKSDKSSIVINELRKIENEER
ncbi:6487_t:CDS:2 [Diversispora eburnea]|uniref:6487_t:CDS:1 n=1 Tax=Diversispora eburnea TaxID=1213867 RepID=A0A9N8YQM0_9GLOM|nr:6487_t:CDS:2 [Diversispora eburnea]